MDVEILNKYVGKKFEIEDEKGNMLACALPLYILKPDLPRYNLECLQNNKFETNWDLLKENFNESSLEEIKIGDVIIIQLPIYRILHFAIYMGNSKMFHCLDLKNGAGEICNISFYKKHIKGIFTWK